MKKPLAGFALLIALGMMNAVAAQERVEPSPVQGDVPATGGVSDAWIATRIKASLVPLTRESHADISVHVLNGVVALAGTVDDEVTREQVLSLSRQTRGVVGVEAASLEVLVSPLPH